MLAEGIERLAQVIRRMQDEDTNGDHKSQLAAVEGDAKDYW